MLKKILRYFSLQKETEDYENIHLNIEKGVICKGTNLWILVLAILIACVGLNINSIPAIVGAMLISPLMGPINGMGYSIAIHDYKLFKQSLNSFSFTVIISLIASTLYFATTPVTTAHSELLARTSPTIYDVLIAFFGGFAGIIAISSTQKGNVIPGVAIATALMPPLCTVGYGIATAQTEFIFGALYLFAINTVCIAISSTIVSQVLKFPIRQDISESKKKKINRTIWFILTITILPSIYLGYKLVEKETFLLNTENYVQTINMVNGNYLLRKEFFPHKKEIVLIYGGNSLTVDEEKEIKNKAKDFSLTETNVIIKQGFSFEKELNTINQQGNELEQEVNRLNLIIKKESYRKDSVQQIEMLGKEILNEISVLYPSIKGCSYTDAFYFEEDSISSEKIDILTFKISKRLTDKEKNKIEKWLSVKLNSENIHVFYETEEK